MRQAPHIQILQTVAVIGIAVGFCILISSPNRNTSRLANGTELSLLGVTHGPSNIFVSPGIWDRLVYRFAPANGIKFGPIKIKPVEPILDLWRNEDGSMDFSNRMVIWIGHSGSSNAPPLPVPKDKWFSDIRGTLADESGEEWELRSGTSQVHPANTHGLKWISAWDFTSFPRRGKILRFRIYAHNRSNQWETLADFTLRNPLRRPYPIWQPSKLPQVEKSGDVEASLVELVSGVETVPYHLGIRPFTRATFAVKENGLATTAWLPDRLTATDATGNEPWVSLVNFYATNGLVNYELQCTHLSPSETWRMQTRFFQAGKADGKPLWTSPQLTVQDGAVVETNIKANVASFLITLECEQNPFTNTIRLKLFPLPKDRRVGPAEIIDNEGRKANYESGSFEDSGFDAQWKIPQGAKWLQVRVNLVETRTFEFVARPVVALGEKR